jgi:DNA-directed RNA polymerase specialized sigma subunit
VTTDYDALFASARELSAKVITRQADEQRRRVVLAAIEGGMSQGDVAKKLGITRARVSQIISNTR